MGDRSELERALEHSVGVPPELVMEDLAEQLGLDAETQPPVDLDLVASLQAITEVTRVPSSHSGCLINERGKLRVELCASDSSERQNFTLSHEICHTLLPGYSMSRNFRCNPGASQPRPARGLAVEWLADVGASELLLPRRYAVDAFAAGGFGWNGIEHVAHCFGASLAATGRRYVRLTDTPAFFASLEFGTSRTNPKPQLRVTSAAWSPELDVFILKNKSISPAHPIVRAANGEDVDEVAEMGDLTLDGRFRVAARLYPYRDRQGDSISRVLVVGRQAVTKRTKRTV